MKKILSLLALVLMSCMGAWAQTTVELTTDESNPRCYMIESYDRGGVLTSNGAGQSVTHVDMSAKGYWYFTKAETNTTNTVAGGVIAHNLDGTLLTNEWKTAAEGSVLYILPNGVNNNGLSICKNAAIQGNDCIDAQNGGRTGVGNWAPTASDWQGTTWKFTPVELPAPAVKLTFSNITTSSADVAVTDGFGKTLSGVTATLETIASDQANHDLKTGNLVPTYGILSPNYSNPNGGGWWELTFKIEGLNDFVFNNIAIDAHGLNAQGAAQTSASKMWKTDFKLGTTADNIADYATAPAEELVVGYYSNPLCHHTISAYGENYTTSSTLYLTVRMSKTAGGGCHAGIASLELTKSAPKVNVTYTITNLYGETFDIVTDGVIGTTAEAPAIDFFSSPVIAEADKTISADNNHFNVSGTWSFPFEEGKKYTMKASNSSKFVADGTNAYGNNSVTVEEGNDLWQFEHVANTLNLYKVKNVKYGYATVANANNQTLVTFAETATPWTEGTGASSYFRITVNGTGFNLQHPGEATANAGNHVSGKLGLWTHPNSPTNDGSCLIVEEFSVATEINKALTIVNNLAGIAGSANVATATASLNSAASINDINTALDAYYATLGGKKFTYESRMYNMQRYLQATAAAAELATSAVGDGKTAKNVFEFEHVSGNTFKVKAPFYNTYLNRYSTNTTASNYELITFGEGYVALQFAGEGNAIHHQQSGTKPVSWATTSDASKWYIAPVTDEEWETLSATIDKAPLEQAIAKAKGYNNHIGTGLNQYSWILEGENCNDSWSSTLEDYEALMENVNSNEEVQNLVREINDMMNQLQINQPADGSFVRVRSVKSGMGYVNAEASTAHTNALKVGAKGASSIYYYKDGKLLAYNCGQYLAKNSDGGGFLSLGEVGNEGCSIAFNKTDAKIGAYAVVFNGNRYLYAGDNATNVDAGSSAGNDAYTFWLEPVGELPVSISAAKYATLYAPVALTIPTDVTAYTLTVEGDYLKATAVEGIIPANTGVVLAAEEAGTYNFAITTSEAFEGQNVLTGTVPTIAKVANALVLGKKDDQIGFYGVKDEVANLAGFKAYYVPTAGESNLRIVFDNDTLTSIITAAQENGGQAIYDLQGRRVVKTQNGLNIVNGKKVIK